MSQTYTVKLKPYIQPFERCLAIDELTVLAGNVPRAVDEGVKCPTDFRINTKVDASVLVDRLAYWELVVARNAFITVQSLRESTVNIVRNGVPLSDIKEKLPFGSYIPLPNRRCLRYGPHGIHEYRGKFFPQLVRSLINIAEIPHKGIIVDPMCGSGTTLVEAALSGVRALGLDMNPLSVEISRTKCNLLKANADTLASVYETVKERLMTEKPSVRNSLQYFLALPIADQRYLQEWFSEQVIRDLDQIIRCIQVVADKPSKQLLTISLSNILRSVSWQKVDDLRIRKEVRPDIEIDPIRDFLEEVGRSVRFVLAFLRQCRTTATASVEITEGDARTADRLWGPNRGKVDAVITSPPYATALPYLETDRLSLCYLQFLTRAEHRRRDDEMIGNREVTQRGRMAYWALYEKQRELLPRSIQLLIARIADLNSTVEVGFRRRNLPALLAKYFLDMRLVLLAIKRLLRPGRPAFIVVGDNHTIAGNLRIEIKTAELLVDLATMVGFQEGNHRPMEMLTSRDIFKRNAVGSETILELRG